MKIDSSQQIQEDQYGFPYHYLPNTSKGFRFNPTWTWGLKYMATTNFLVDLIKLKKGKLIDVGCGDGRLLHEISEVNSNLELFGLDYSESAIKLASALNRNVVFCCNELNIADIKFDCVCCIEVLEHIPLHEVSGFVDSLLSKIAKGGSLILTVPHLNVSVQKKHFQHFNEDKLKAIFGKKLEFERWLYLDIKSKRFDFLMRLFINKFYQINFPSALKWLYDKYVAEYLTGPSEENCRRIGFVARII